MYRKSSLPADVWGKGTSAGSEIRANWNMGFRGPPWNSDSVETDKLHLKSSFSPYITKKFTFVTNIWGLRPHFATLIGSMEPIDTTNRIPEKIRGLRIRGKWNRGRRGFPVLWSFSQDEVYTKYDKFDYGKSKIEF